VSLPNSNQRLKTAQVTKKQSKIKSLGQTALANELERNSLSESESQKNQLQTVQVTKPSFVRNSEENLIGTTQKTFSESNLANNNREAVELLPQFPKQSTT